MSIKLLVKSVSKITSRPLVTHYCHYNIDHYKNVKVEHLTGPEQGISLIILNRPEQKNAISTTFLSELTTAIATLSPTHDNNAAKTRVLLIKSAVPGVFCAGADLKERLNMPPEDVPHFVQKIRTLADKIHALQFPVIAALDGLALGGGLELALSCDLRVATTTAKLGLVETKLAIIPGAGGTQRLPRLINPAVAKELIFTGRVIDGATALSLGLVNHAVEQNEAGNAAYLKSMDIAREILPNGPYAIRMAKRAINNGLQVDLNAALEYERECYGYLLMTRDRVEGLKAFQEKRKPVYTGS